MIYKRNIANYHWKSLPAVNLEALITPFRNDFPITTKCSNLLQCIIHTSENTDLKNFSRRWFLFFWVNAFLRISCARSSKTLHCIWFDSSAWMTSFSKSWRLVLFSNFKTCWINDIKLNCALFRVSFCIMKISPSLNGINYLYFKYCKSIYQIIFFRNFDASICSSFVAWRHQVDRFLIEQFDRAQAPSCTTIDLDFTSRLDSNNHSSFIFFLLQPLVCDVLVYFSSFQ